ncbi:MAG TPA: HD domain-containing protein [Thermoleophilia bacterium]|nr:HD domain-containing protein [Thermoleophilia bacterium]HQG02992.1 HD domain-containing protein [Thermoleophilia bacterium]HQG54318.1 HD domain-containing protein [Thermoleophilia bacterium]HQJ98180.1 HD domain-containing protein [Thermoleophilia bacterium]
MTDRETAEASPPTPQAITVEDVRHDDEVRQFVRKADENLAVLGYTEHGPRHAGLVADIAQNVLLRLGRPRREAELAAVAGYLHDIGNGISRLDHGIAAALIAQRVLERLGMPPDEVVEVMCAIGNHEEEYGEPVSALAAAVILADKSDVHRSRVRVIDPTTDDIHDRVNSATRRSFLAVDPKAKTITLQMEIDTGTIHLMEYFEIFLERMVMCRKAAEALGCRFGLEINGTQLL